ncbi:MAG: hypothetical protein JXA25_08730 [Anaerolineales bacterium]|nr:hypothetical protein [Anaerolineales bacterium]
MRIRNAFGLFCVVSIFLLSACSQTNSAENQQGETSSGDTSRTAVPALETPAPISPTPTYPPAELVEIMPDWFQYTNYRLGFTMEIPRLMYRHDAGCYWKEEDGDSSFRPQGGLMPVVVVEGENRVYITSKYLMYLIEPTQIPSGAGYRYEYGGCDMRPASVEVLEEDENTSFRWVIAVWPVETDEDLEMLVDAYYDPCYTVGEMELDEELGYYRVKMVGDGKPPEESECLVNFGYTINYSPEIGIAATWYQGQSIHFAENAMNDPSFDARMRDSFRFLTP